MFETHERAVKRALDIEDGRRIPKELSDLVESMEKYLNKCAGRSEYPWESICAAVAIFEAINGEYKIPKQQVNIYEDADRLRDAEKELAKSILVKAKKREE